MGQRQRNDAARVQRVFSLASKLRERPIGEDGSDRGVAQYIGVNEDMPLYVVEAGEKVTSRTVDSSSEADAEHEVIDDDDIEMLDEPARGLIEQSNQLPMYSDDSPLTSLGSTPSPVKQTFHGGSPEKPSARPSAEEAVAPLVDDHTLDHILESARGYANHGQSQALCLDIELSPKSFLPPTTKNSSNASMGKDLKIETFINGQLADVNFVNTRRSGAQLTRDKVRFSGTRLHRQVEKPWIYAPNQDAAMAGDGERVSDDATSRWNSVSSSLVDEA